MEVLLTTTAAAMVRSMTTTTTSIHASTTSTRTCYRMQASHPTLASSHACIPPRPYTTPCRHPTQPVPHLTLTSLPSLTSGHHRLPQLYHHLPSSTIAYHSLLQPNTAIPPPPTWVPPQNPITHHCIHSTTTTHKPHLALIRIIPTDPHLPSFPSSLPPSLSLPSLQSLTTLPYCYLTT